MYLNPFFLSPENLFQSTKKRSKTTVIEDSPLFPSNIFALARKNKKVCFEYLKPKQKR